MVNSTGPRTEPFGTSQEDVYKEEGLLIIMKNRTIVLSDRIAVLHT